MTDTAATPAEAVRNYLVYLSDPNALVDTTAQEKLQAQIADAKDPLERLQLISRLRSIETVDEAALEAGFVRCAAEYAQAEQILPEAFLEMGIASETLRRAGLLRAPRGSARQTPRRQTAKGRGSKRQGASGGAERTTRESVASVIPSGPFTLRQLQESSGASALTVRKVVENLLADGRAVSLGTDSAHKGPGRAPNLYQVVSAPETALADEGAAPVASVPTSKRRTSQKSPTAAKRKTSSAASRKAAPSEAGAAPRRSRAGK